MQALPVKIAQPFVANAVVTAILGTVGKVGAIGPDAGRNQWSKISIGLILQEFVACAAGKLDRYPEHGFDFAQAHATGTQSVDAGLVAGRRNTLSTRIQIVAVQRA
jgi:hypothetical protein